MAVDRPQIQLSLLDRLIDNEPGVSRDPLNMRNPDFNQVKAMVARDIEKLLNTKGTVSPPPQALKEVTNSLYTYGLMDFTSSNPKSQATRQKLRIEIEQTIARFEPRLKNVNVRVEPPSPHERNLKFKIAGLLVLDPVTEPVAFDTLFDIGRGEYAIPK